MSSSVVQLLTKVAFFITWHKYEVLFLERGGGVSIPCRFACSYNFKKQKSKH